MNEPHVVRDQVTVRATPEQVWRALTDPDLTEQFFFKTRVRSDWRPGSPIAFERTILWLFPFRLEGTIVEAVPGKRLVYTLRNKPWFGKEDPAHCSTVTDDLSADGDQTTLSITDDVGAYKGAAARYARSVRGWATILAGLKRVVESEDRAQGGAMLESRSSRD